MYRATELCDCNKAMTAGKRDSAHSTTSSHRLATLIALRTLITRWRLYPRVTLRLNLTIIARIAHVTDSALGVAAGISSAGIMMWSWRFVVSLLRWRLFVGLFGRRLFVSLLRWRLFVGLFGRRLFVSLLRWRLFVGLFGRRFFVSLLRWRLAIFGRWQGVWIWIWATRIRHLGSFSRLGWGRKVCRWRYLSSRLI